VRTVDGDDTHYIVDFGRSWVGGGKLRVPNGVAGQVVDVFMGEAMADENAVRWNTQAGNHYRDQYTLADGTQVISIWGYRVFRYAELTGAPAGLTADDILAEALIYPCTEHEASFSSSNSNLDRVWRFTRDSINSLRFDLYYDSPTRERTADNAGDTYNISMASSALSADHSPNRFSINYALGHRSPLTEWRLAEVIAMRDDWYVTGDDWSVPAFVCPGVPRCLGGPGAVRPC
jgi:alpha-L-rhamnosidase